MAGKIVINGSGISGLLCALLLSQRGEASKILMLDKNQEPGGLLRRFQYDTWGDFDYGMHNMLETGLAELDQLLFSLLPETEWQLLEDGKRDLAGAYFNGRLQKHTPYIDLRNLSPADCWACIADLLLHLDAQGLGDPPWHNTTAYEYAVRRFGKLCAEKAIVPAIEKVHKKSATELDYMATLLTPMTRVTFCGEALAGELTESPALRSRIAWPEQRTLPLERSSGRRGFYPVRYGMYRVVEALVHRLRAAGVQLLTGSEIVALTTGTDGVRSVTVRRDGAVETVETATLVWTGNIPLLGRLLKLDYKDLAFDKPLKTIIVNLVVDRLPEPMEDLYYFFCYDPRFHTFRLTNFSNYCRGAARNGGYPISMELLMREEDVASTDIAALAVDEYQRFGFGASSRVLFVKSECLDSGFPMPSVNNIRSLRSIRNRIREMPGNNLQLVGILAEDNLFFQTDVLVDVYRKLA